jgi:hypothetical protein
MKIFNKSILIIAALLMISLSSCWDKDYLVWDFTQGAPVVEFNKIPNSQGLHTYSFNMTTEPVQAIVRVNLASVWTLDEDLTVTLGMDPTLIDDYNDEHGTSYVMMNASAYSFGSTTLVIPAGEREVDFPVTLQLNLIDLSQPLLIPLAILSTDNPDVIISGNSGTAMLKVTLKDNYWTSYKMYHPIYADGAAYDEGMNPDDTLTWGDPDFGTGATDPYLKVVEIDGVRFIHNWAWYGSIYCFMDITATDVVAAGVPAGAKRVTVGCDDYPPGQWNDAFGQEWNYTYINGAGKRVFKIYGYYTGSFAANDYGGSDKRQLIIHMVQE